MSDSVPTNNAPGFVWILGSFAAFAVLTVIIQSNFGNTISDPAAAGRLANKKEITEAQTAMVTKMNLVQGKSTDTLAKAVESLKAQKPSTSTMLIPGSPTQLKQAAAVGPSSATPPATTPAPATPPATAPAPATPPAAPAK